MSTGGTKPSGRAPVRVPWIGLGRLRLATGLWLLFFATGHLLNHALGLVSLGTAEAGRLVFLAFWRLPPVEASLAAALLTHLALGLWQLWRRRTLRMPLADAVQLVLGLAIPLYLTTHVLATGWLHRCCGVEDTYTYQLGALWPHGALSQATLTGLAWTHGMIGLYRWLRLRPALAPLLPALLVIGTLLPAMALAGFASAGREAAALRDASPVTWAAFADAQGWPSPELRAALVQTPGRWIVDAFAVLVALVLLLRMLRWAWLRRRNVVLDYPGGRQVVVPRGLTVLEASRMAGIPHAAVCGGRGRCSTCRIRVGRGADRLSLPEAGELQVLARIGAPPGVRLACQARLDGNLALTPLLPAGAGAMSLLDPVPQALGVERDLVVLFGDLRDFTRLSENRLPYDTVFVLNRYFRAMGVAIEAAGGRVDKFIGDGVMALFGMEGSTAEAARDGLAAARAMVRALDQVNEELGFELDAPLRMGVGLHLGPVILGQMGHGRTRALTAIGDTVNVASRLEALTKQVGCLLIVSDRVLRAGGIEPAGAQRREIDLRGRDGRLAVWLLSDLSVLPSEPASRGRKRRRRSWPLAGWA